MAMRLEKRPCISHHGKMEREQFMEWLKHVDANGDGMISKKELQDALRELGMDWVRWKARRGMESSTTESDDIPLKLSQRKVCREKKRPIFDDPPVPPPLIASSPEAEANEIVTQAIGGADDADVGFLCEIPSEVLHVATPPPVGVGSGVAGGAQAPCYSGTCISLGA
ncbi:hypothetical protein J5N97_016920 [Dioscorea zingiberensis]|uniref:EF-hand domain-containing protein n=1 Tax=Dioscorea zingiberensis TaxID=325984 RepID=A0A9D5HFV7_9LILI|nr:hypothetical protein J5N97_016920 [Dioscorea zingiberensis]